MIRAALRSAGQRAADNYVDAVDAALYDAAAEALQGRSSWSAALGRAHLRLVVPTARLVLGLVLLGLSGVGERTA